MFCESTIKSLVFSRTHFHKHNHLFDLIMNPRACLNFILNSLFFLFANSLWYHSGYRIRNDISMQKESSFALHALDVIITILGYCMGYYSTSDRNHETGNRLFFENRKFQSWRPEVEKYRIGKLMSFLMRVIFLFFDS